LTTLAISRSPNAVRIQNPSNLTFVYAIIKFSIAASVKLHLYYSYAKNLGLKFRIVHPR